MRMSPRENKSVLAAKEKMLKSIPDILKRLERLENIVSKTETPKRKRGRPPKEE